jgi:hypothetical protein
MYKDLSNSNEFPKTLLIRNSVGGMIWQVYHVNNLHEVEVLSKNATNNGFESVTLVDYDISYEETFPDWRSECDWL